MQSKLFLLLILAFIVSLIFSSTNKKRKRQTEENNILNPQDENTQDGNTQENYSQITYQPVPPSTSNLQINNIIFSDLLKLPHVEISTVPSNSLNKLLKKNPNIFRYIFAYLTFFELEFNFKYISTTFYDLYEKFLQEEKLLLKEHLKNKTKFLENINCKRRVYFDFFEKRHWSNPGRTEYVNVDCFCEHLIVFPKSIRQIIWFTFEEIEYKYVLFKDGHLSTLKKVNKEGHFVFTSVDNHDFNFFRNGTLGETHLFQENIRYMEIEFDLLSFRTTKLVLHKIDNFSQNIKHTQDKKIIISNPFRLRNTKLFLKNGSGYLWGHDDKSVSLWEFKKLNNGIYIESLTHIKTNIKEIKSNDFEHYAADVPFIYHTN